MLSDRTSKRHRSGTDIFLASTLINDDDCKILDNRLAFNLFWQGEALWHHLQSDGFLCDQRKWSLARADKTFIVHRVLVCLDSASQNFIPSTDVLYHFRFALGIYLS